MRVSAVIPVFNGEAWLAEALRSVRAQTRPVDELIVVDDGSTDRSVEIARGFGAVVELLPENRGEGAARNAGIRRAKGDAIAWLDADDYWAPHHIATVAGLLERCPEAAAAFAAVRAFGLADHLVTGYVPPGPPVNVFWAAFADWLHTTIGSLTRRSALLAIGGFAEDERLSVDFDLWMRLAREHRFVATHEVTSYWRWHADQQSRKLMDAMAAVYRFRRRYRERELARGDPEVAAQMAIAMRRAWRRDIAEAHALGKHDEVRGYEALAALVPGLSWRDRALLGLGRLRRGIAGAVPRRQSA